MVLKEGEATGQAEARKAREANESFHQFKKLSVAVNHTTGILMFRGGDSMCHQWVELGVKPQPKPANLLEVIH